MTKPPKPLVDLRNLERHGDRLVCPGCLREVPALYVYPDRPVPVCADCGREVGHART